VDKWKENVAKLQTSVEAALNAQTPQGSIDMLRDAAVYLELACDNLIELGAK